MSALTLTITTNKDCSKMVKVGQPVENMKRICNLLQGLKSGVLKGTVLVSSSTVTPVRASATATLASVAADDTITIGAVVLTAKAAPTLESQFSQAGTDTADAASLVSKINAHSVLKYLVVASSAAGVVTIRSIAPGLVGNFITLTSSNARITVTGSGYLASGAGGVSSNVITIGR